jgi:NTP pyrophosphatase (non-canonical NTP hydrolase)
MTKIFEEIKQERKKQDKKWGIQNHIPIEWCAILGEETGEVQKEALETHFNFKYYRKKRDYAKYRKELIQVAAVAIAMIECLDRNNKEK